jgi:hypothetical protein
MKEELCSVNLVDDQLTLKACESYSNPVKPKQRASTWKQQHPSTYALWKQKREAGYGKEEGWMGY